VIMSQADRERLDRLAGDGRNGAGIDLASLFRVILNQVQDSPDGASELSLAGPVKSALSNHARVEHWYGANGDDPWPALIGDALAQLESRKLVSDAGDGWRTGSAFVTGKRRIVIPARKGKHGSVGVILYPAAERAALGETEKRRMEITSLAASLREDGPGLRPLASEHVDALAQSMRDYGYRPEFPVLVDQYDRIIDGRHRIAAAPKAGITDVPLKRITVASDEEAVGLAILVNIERGWTRAERSRIDRDLQAAGLCVENFGRQLGTAAKRELITIALQENPRLSHNAVARRLSVSPQTVIERCRDLVANSQIENCGHHLTEDGKQAPGPRPETRIRDAEIIRERDVEDLDWGEIAQKHGLKAKGAEDAYRKATGARDREPARVAASSPRLETPPADVPQKARQAAGDLPSWQMVAELFRRLPPKDKAAFLAAIGSAP
jgi:DNA-binding Lrp family transcriptional regulator